MKRIAIVMVLSIAVLTMSIAPASANEAEPPHCKDGHGKDCDPRPPECKPWEKDCPKPPPEPCTYKCDDPKPPHPVPPPHTPDNDCVNGSCNTNLFNTPPNVINNPPGSTTNYYVSNQAKKKGKKGHHKRHR